MKGSAMGKSKTGKAVTSTDAATLERAIQNVQQFAHVRVRAVRGHLHISPDTLPVARATPLGAGRFGLSFRSHSGKWEPMPFSGLLTDLAHDILVTLGPFLQRWNFSDTNSGSGH